MGMSATKLNCLLLGLDGVGKTTILYGMRLEEVNKTFKETIGFNYETINKVFASKKFELHMWDLAGKKELRSLWPHYYNNMHVQVCIFVVNPNRRDQLPEARKAFHTLVHEEGMRDALMVILSNVKNQGDEMLVKEEELKVALGLHDIDPTLIPIKIFQVNAYNARSFQPVLEYICRKYATSG